MTEEYELFPGSRSKSRPAFVSQEEYERFREEFARAVKPALDRYARARALSEQSARHHYVRR